MPQAKKLPEFTQHNRSLPDPRTNQPLIQEPSEADRLIPQPGSPENTVLIGNQQVEIRPTKLKYQRNRTAMFYKMQELYPLADILAMDAGTFGDDRDGDKAVMDWLIAVTDDPEQVVAHYDELDTGVIEKLQDIFRRVNRIDEKEAKQKNALAARTG